jgi:hypothetical protein
LFLSVVLLASAVVSTTAVNLDSNWSASIEDRIKLAGKSASILGIDLDTFRLNSIAERITVRVLDDSCTIPFLLDSSSNRKILVVRVDSITYGSSRRCEAPRSAEIWFESKTKCLLQIHLWKSHLTNALESIPFGTYFAKQIENAMYAYEGKPEITNVRPVIQTLMEAFTLSSPCNAVESYIWCFSLSRFESEPFKVWCLVDRYVIEIDREADRCVTIKNYLTIVNAESGSTLGIMNTR